MLNWLKAKLRDWLLDDPRDFDLEVNRDGKREFVSAVGFRGIRLLCTGTGSDEFLVSAASAVDSRRFWLLWNRLKAAEGDGRALCWEDGAPVDDPSELL